LLEVEAQAAPKTSLPKEVLLQCARRFPETFWVMAADEDIAGYILFDKNGHVHSMVVKPMYRRKGIGTTLVMRAQEQIPKSLWVEVRAKNSGAISFYRKLGMTIVGTVQNYYGNDDALIMVLPREF
jgi:ribosomal-protein-alanine N-acetyltransferase